MSAAAERPVPSAVTEAMASGAVRLTTRAPGPGRGLADEVERLAWLAEAGVAAAAVVLHHREADGHEWLVTEPPAGTPASSAEHHFDPQSLAVGVARLLRQLHNLPVESCPFLAPVEHLVATAHARVEAELVSSADFDEAYRTFGPADLLEKVLLTRPTSDGDLVVVHGAPFLENLWLAGPDAGGVVAVADLGVGDRHLDLAVVARSLVAHLGPEAVAAFLEAYDGADPDDLANPSLLRLDFFAGLSQFLPRPT